MRRRQDGKGQLTLVLYRSSGAEGCRVRRGWLGRTRSVFPGMVGTHDSGCDGGRLGRWKDGRDFSENHWGYHKMVECRQGL